MKSPTERELLDFLAGELDEEGRRRVLDAAESDPEIATQLREAARGLAGVRGWSGGVAVGAVGEGGDRDPLGADPVRSGAHDVGRDGPGRRGRRRRVPAWAVPLTAAATLALAVPGTLALSSAPEVGEGPTAMEGAPGRVEGATFAGAPRAPEPSFVLVLQGRWPDAANVDETERLRRAEEYWAWTSELAERGVLVAAGDLLWEPGFRVDPAGDPDPRGPETLGEPGFLVGMFALRTDSYEEALALARECPHLRYGGSIAVRRVGSGFVTVPGMGDWSE